MEYNDILKYGIFCIEKELGRKLTDEELEVVKSVHKRAYGEGYNRGVEFALKN